MRRQTLDGSPKPLMIIKSLFFWSKREKNKYYMLNVIIIMSYKQTSRRILLINKFI